MGIFFLILKSLLILFFLVMFLRTNKPAWGVGLLTVTSAILLDAFLGTLGREAMLEELGFFFYVIVGALITGGATWLWAITRGFIYKPVPSVSGGKKDVTNSSQANRKGSEVINDETLHSLIEELQTSLTYEDLFDLAFDLGYPQGELIDAKERYDQLAQAILQKAQDRGEIEALEAAVVRIISPIPAENLPRIEKLSSDSPPTILRHYLLNGFSLPALDDLSQQLELNITGDEPHVKRLKIRQLLSELYKRNDIGSLIEILQASSHEAAAAEDEIHE